MSKSDVKDYFNVNSFRWLQDAYEKGGYEYPIGYHRVRITLKIIDKEFGCLLKNRTLRALDIGCGGGHLSIAAARAGFKVTGIDISAAMLESARRNLESSGVGANVEFLQADFRELDLPKGAYDLVTAMGLIEYLPEESVLLKTAFEILRPGGILVLDCRNRLFNMISVSDYTKREIESGAAKELVDEIQALYSEISIEKAGEFIEGLKGSMNAIRDSSAQIQVKKREAGLYVGSLEGKQQTPKQLKRMGEEHGFNVEGYYGVHPHLLFPRLNYLLPIAIFNQLSDSLIPFEDQPVGLIWSSKFIAVLRNNSATRLVP